MSMKRAFILSAVLLSFASAAHAADCKIEKDAPVIPNGASASETEMVSTQKAVKDYVSVTQEYLACLEMANKGRTSGSWTKEYNDATSKMEKIAKDFNAQLKAFKSK